MLSSVKYYELKDSNAGEFYDEWRFKTMAIIRKKGWSAPFDDPTAVIPTRSRIGEADATEEEKNLFKANAEAYDQFLMGCSGVPMGLVRRANGDARNAIKRLDEKYARQDSSNLMELLREFTSCKLESTSDDPDGWFLKLDGINEKLRNIQDEYAKKDYEIKAHLLGNLPEGYEDVETKCGGQEASMSVEDIEKEISNKWRRSYKQQADKKAGDSKNLAMTVEGNQKGGQGGGKRFTKKFKGRCRNCGKQGHKKSECRSDKKGVCFNCGEDGHFARDCPKPKKDGDKRPSEGTGMFIGMAHHVFKTSSTTGKEGMYLLDSGADVHVVSCGDGLIDPLICDQRVTIGDGSTMQATKKGTLYLKKDNTILKLEDTLMIPNFSKNIISVGRLTKAGNKIYFEGPNLIIENPLGGKITVQREEDTCLYYLDSSVVGREEAQVYATLIENDEEQKKKPDDAEDKNKNKKEKKKEIDINDAHELYGHVSNGVLKPLLTTRGYVVVNTKKRCEACAFAKARAKGVSKTTSMKAHEKGERLFLDISGPYKMSLKGSKYWLLVVDDKTRKAWSFFIQNKSEAKKATEMLLQLLKGAKVVTKYIRCDNAGENVKGIKELCNTYGIQIELTPPNSPQFNGVVERKFVTLRDRAQAMMLGARMDEDHQGRLWAEAVYTANRLHNAVPNRAGLAPDELWYGKPPKLLDNLVQFGRIGYVTIRNTTAKLTPKSIKMVMLGYAPDHAGDVYRLYNPETKRIVESRDVTWAEWHGGPDVPESLKMFAKDMAVDVDDDEIHDEVPDVPATTPDAPARPVVSDDEEDDTGAGRKVSKSTPASSSAKTTRVSRELARLRTSYNPASEQSSSASTPSQGNQAGHPENISHVSENSNDGDDEATTMRNESVQVHYVFNATLASDPGEPKTLGEALHGPDRMKWIIAAKKEIENFLKRDAWKKVPLSVLKQGQRPISTKWVFKVKNEHDGTKRYKGRIVVRGFVQIPGIDFNLTHSPVATDVSIKIVLGLTLHYENIGWDIEMLDIEAAFLEAELDEDVYIEWPEGVVMFGYVDEADTKGTCLKLEKAMYGAVQSPRAFWNENAKHLINIGMKQSKTDPCVWYKWKDEELWLVAAVYVDDIVYAGSQEAREWFKAKVKTRFTIADLGKLSKHLGVWYQRKKDDRGSFYELTMTKYQSDIMSDWKGITNTDVRAATTPGYPGESLVRNKDEEGINVESYRKILGKVMWFCKKVMPECGNAIRELASSMDRPGEQQWRSLERLIGYISNNDPATLVLRKPRDLKVYGYVDSNWATNKETRRSVTGYVLTLGGCLINWVSKTQPAVTLSSTEAEYVAASICATDIKFVQMLLEEIVPSVDARPATLLEDNTGAIYLMENQAVGNRTKHIDIRMHHIREMMHGNTPRMVVRFTPSELNFADPMTKNVTEAIHRELVPALKDGTIADCIYETVDREDVKNRTSVRMSPARDQVGTQSKTSGFEDQRDIPRATYGPDMVAENRKAKGKGKEQQIPGPNIYGNG
jgi:transposase InsO family protein